jgi:hypothetical protein
MVPAVGSSSEKRAADGTNVGEWLVNVAGDVVLPMTTLEVVDGLRQGKLSEQSLVWRIGMHDWTSISDVPQLCLAAGFEAALAVYDRPPASLTFSTSERDDGQGNVEAARLTPVPSVAAPLPLEPAPSTLPNSLAPTTAEADPGDRVRSPSAWDDLDELLSNERRADQRSSRRVVLGAALGSATLAAIFALLLLRSAAPDRTEPPAQAPQASEAPAPAATLETEAIAAPSASVEPPAHAASRSAPQSLAPRFARRTTRSASTAASSQAPVDVQQGTLTAPDTTAAVPSVTVVPAEPAPAASAGPERAPIAPIAPDSP